ncbi:P-loop containing nucleoside triphosphate hydrolase protein [Morchella conica CCBAS932]|uniref:P-loop containing nucleoside triphosphate hydrolase protein n=1 Tax=Morchella conica CCBAS932 TaxID=1392247 RepID=A0A3N4L0U4_9PEZI|nr:P-loop containing nucleoside triphosphate hydrolase protein [Morchella conica CCBAS932]
MKSAPRASVPKPTAQVVSASVYSSITVPIILSSGETLHVRKKAPKIGPTRESFGLSSGAVGGDSGEGLDEGLKKSYFGVDISSLLSDYNAEKRIQKIQQEKAALKAADKAADEALAAALKTDLEISGTKCKKTQLWTEKYRAKRFTDLVGDERTHRQVLRWFKRWDKIVFPSANSKAKKTEEGDERELRKILLIHGPPGLGKTTLAHVAAKQAGYEVVEVNASDDRSAEVVKGRVKDTLSNGGVKSMGMVTSASNCAVTLGKPVCLVVDEIDGASSGGSDGSFVGALVDLVLSDQKGSSVIAPGVTKNKRKNEKEELFKLQRPVVAICNDLYAPALRALRPLAEIVYMRKPPAKLMVGRIKNVLNTEGFRVEDGAVRRLVELSCTDSAGKAGGDMRAAMVGCEWIAARLRATAEPNRIPSEKKYLTRKMVEEEFGEGGLGDTDGKGGSSGRGSVKEAVERVFYTEEVMRGKKETNANHKKTNIQNLRQLVEGIDEFDKIMSGCFATYLTRPYNDDPYLTKPNAASEWLWFQDLLSERVFQEQDYELSGYLSSPILAFHLLFSSPIRQKAPQSKYNRKDHEEEEEMAPFSGPQAEWEVREGTKEHKALIASVQTCIKKSEIRLHEAFHAAENVVMELAPWVSRILSPNIKPVVIGGSGPEGGVASVRREGEKKLVMRGVQVMMGLGVMFERVKVEGIGSGGWGWIYRMEPPLDSLSIFRTSTIPPGELAPAPVRYAIRQVLSQSLYKQRVAQREASRQARMGTSLEAPQLKMVVNLENMLKRKKNEVKKDFFGRVIAPDEPQIGEEEEGTRCGKRKKVQEDKNETVWLSFHEGFSNAVRKGVTLDEFMSGLM